MPLNLQIKPMTFFQIAQLFVLQQLKMFLRQLDEHQTSLVALRALLNVQHSHEVRELLDEQHSPCQMLELPNEPSSAHEALMQV